MSTETIADVIAALRQPRTMSQFKDSAELASDLLNERALIADRLEALEARFVVVGYASATNLADYRANHRGTFAVWKDADDHDDVPVYAAAQRQEQEGP